MTRLFKHKIFIYLFSFIMIFMIEVALLSIVFNNAIPTYIALELFSLSMILCPILIFRSTRTSIIYTTLIFIVFSVFYLINVTLHYASNDIFSLNYLQLADEAASVFNMEYINWGYVAILLAIGLVLFSGLFLSCKFYKYDKEQNPQILLGISMTAIILLASVSIKSMVYDQIEFDNSDKAVYADKSGAEIIEFSSKNLKRSSLKKYGLINYTLGELGTIISFSQTPDQKEINEYLNSGEMLNATNSEYFGTLKDMNVITIMIETGCSFAINEYLTPNLWELRDQGLAFDNNLTKNKTNTSEYIGIAGSVTSSMEDGYEIPFSIPTILKEYGYESNYFHCNYSDLYSRGSVIEKLGFDNQYFVLDVDPDLQWHHNYNGNYPLDTEFYEKIEDELVPESNEPFYSFWTTLITHGPYNYSGASINKRKFERLGYYDKIEEAKNLGLWENICSDDSKLIQEQILWYQCAMMNFDDALGMLIDRLEETNKLDNTLLVLYGDHDIYYDIGLDKALKCYVHNTDDPHNPLQYETIMMMYNPTLTAKFKGVNGLSNNENAVIKDFTSPYIIVPTVLELLGISYNKNNYVGTSIFQTKTPLDNIFYSHELNIFFTDKISGSDLTSYSYMNTSDIDYINLMEEKTLQLIDKIDKFHKMYNLNYFG